MSRGDFGFHKEETRYEYDFTNSMPNPQSEITTVMSVNDFNFLQTSENFNFVIKTIVRPTWNLFLSPARSKWIKLPSNEFFTLKPTYWRGGNCTFSCFYSFTDADGWNDTILIQFTIAVDIATYIYTNIVLVNEQQPIE